MMIGVCLSFVVFCLLYLNSIHKKYRLARPLRCATRVYNKLYGNVHGNVISRVERERLQSHDDSLVYGEIQLTEFGHILNSVPIHSGKIFYDLGCGTGKAVIGAALLHSWKKCCGIELLPALLNCCHEVKAHALSLPVLARNFKTHLSAIEFKEQNLLAADFSEADVIFLHATTFHPSLWQPLILKLNQLKPNTHVIVATKKLSTEYFELINAMAILMTWGECSVFIYRKK